MSEQELERALQKYGDAVLRAAYAVVGNKADSDDVFQDVFFALYRRSGVFASDTHCKAWLIRVAVNKAKNIRASAWNRKRAVLTESLPAQEQAADDGDMAAAMRELNPDARAVIYLHYYEGYAFGEIAQILKIRETTVRSIASRAREKMRQYLE